MDKNQIQTYLQEMKIPIRLACTLKNGWPIVLSLWYIYLEGKVYLATQKSAKVVSYLKSNPRCGFEVASDQPPYRGVRGIGTAKINEENGLEVLKKLLKRYLGGTDSPLAKKLLSRKSPEVAIEIEPTSFFTWDFTKRMKDSLSDQ
ncbi:MAG: pyridoxamine 5'-phosphate oxidase family protein [Candidatus Hodarchaeota archaeon]